MATTAAIIGAAAGAYGAYSSKQGADKALAHQKSIEKEQELKAQKQQALIDAETKKQEKVAEERKARMDQRELLFGSEQGLTDNTEASLLGAK